MSSDQDILEAIEGRYVGIRDAVTGVVEGWHTGLFVHGEGGLGKSYCILGHLERIAPGRYVPHNARLSAWGLYQSLCDRPADVHVIEDCESLFLDPSRAAIGLLRAALWSQAHQRHPPREITWKSIATQRDKLAEKVVFTGGLIFVSNLDLGSASADVRAVQSRVTTLKLSFSKEEVGVLIRHIAAEGYRFGDDLPPLPPDKCREVADFVLGLIDKYQRPPDLRMVVSGFRDFLQWREGSSEQHWQQLIEARFQQAPLATNPKVKRLEEIALAKKIYLDTTFVSVTDKLAEWTAQTGKGKDAFYGNLKKHIKQPGGRFSSGPQ